MEKKFVWLGLFVGSFIGGLIPELWGADFLSWWSFLFSFLGGIAGIWVGYKVGQSL
jgi:predicted MFS family arabinose efflux permease